MFFIKLHQPYFFDLINKKTTKITKNNPTPKYKTKLDSGSGKKNKITIPTKITKAIKLLSFINKLNN